MSAERARLANAQFHFARRGVCGKVHASLVHAMGLLGKISEIIRGRRQQQRQQTKRAYLLSLYMGEANSVEGPDRSFRPNRERQRGKSPKGQDSA
jgi:hypothetical protein